VTEKTCDRCGGGFECGASEGSCWCAEIVLGETARDGLAARFDDCLCPACLAEEAAASELPPV
jgi:hypothetical protein